MRSYSLVSVKGPMSLFSGSVNPEHSPRNDGAGGITEAGPGHKLARTRD